MMKKLLFFFSFLWVALMANAEGSLTLGNDLAIKPGNEIELKVLLNNTVEVQGFQATFVLPEGLSFVEMDWDGEPSYAIPADRAANAFSGATLAGDGSLTIAGLATKAKDRVKPLEGGEFLTLKVKAASTATLGIAKIKMNEVNIAYPANTISNETYSTEFDINIYQTYEVTVAANTAAMGTVEGGNNEAMSNSQITVKATANEGYKFVNWKEGDTEVATTADYTFTVTKDVTLTANFAPNQYTITFVLDNGEENVVKTQDYATELKAPENLVKTGYTFAGWNPEVPATVPAGDKTYTAQWTINQYTITFDTDGGSAIDAITQNYDTDITAPADPTKEGYTFAGWDKAIPAKMPAENMTIKATWTINQYKMTFVLDNGEENIVKTQDYGTDLVAPAPAKEGHTFKGWNPEVPATIPAEDKTFTAQWEVNSYAVKFIVDDVTVKEGNVEYGKPIEKPADPTKTGWTFAGWTPEIPATMPAAEQTFTAQWTVNKHTVTFYDQDGTTELKKEVDVAYGTPLKPLAPAVADKQLGTGTLPFVGWDPELTDEMTMPDNDITFKAVFGGEFDVVFIVDGETVKSGKVEYGKEIEKPADPTKEGYTFTGWSPEVPATMPAQALTFTAQWQINQYTMTFVLGNGEEDVKITADYGTALTAPANLTRTGYTFQAWTPAVPATIPAENKTFTAVWTLNYYELAFYANDEIVQKLNVGFDQPITAPEAPAVEGYEFKGWFDTNGTAFADFGGKMAANALAFYAKYEVMQFTMTFKAGDVVVSQQTLDYGMTIDTDFEAPDKEGFLWAGWDPEVPETVPAQNMTFEAVYEKFDGLYWNFRQTKTAVADFKANANQWSGTVSKFAYIPETDGEPLMLGDQELKDTKGLLFKGAANKFRLDINTQLCMNGQNLQLTIPGLKKTQRITIECKSASDDTARSLTVSNAEIESGFELKTGNEGIQMNICNVTANGDVTFTTTGGMNIFRIIVEPALLPGSMEEAVAILKEEIQKAIDLLDNANGALIGDEDMLAEAIAEAEELIAIWESEHKGSIEEMDEATKKLQDAEATFKVVTGIQGIAANKLAGKEVYSISGQKMENGALRKGLYIINGKKVVVK